MSAIRRGDLAGLGRLGLRALDRRPAQREAGLLAGGDREARAHRRLLDRRLDAGAHRDPVGPAERAPAARLGAEQRPHEPVLAARRELQRQLDLALDALDEPQQLVRRVVPELVAALPLRHGERVGQAHAAGLGRERRLDHERAGQVAPLAS